MAGRWRAVLVLAFAGAAAAPPAAGQEVVDEGCAALADAVHAAVTEFVDAGGFGTRPAATLTGGGGFVDGTPLSCGRTAAVASAAFGHAFARVGVPVEWPAAGLAALGYCTLHDLERCQPAGRDAGVVDAWQAVVGCLERYMPFGTDGDVSRFRTGDLAVALAVALAGAARKIY